MSPVRRRLTSPSPCCGEPVSKPRPSSVMCSRTSAPSRLRDTTSVLRSGMAVDIPKGFLHDAIEAEGNGVGHLGPVVSDIEAAARTPASFSSSSHRDLSASTRPRMLEDSGVQFVWRSRSSPDRATVLLLERREFLAGRCRQWSGLRRNGAQRDGGVKRPAGRRRHGGCAQCVTVPPLAPRSTGW